MSCNESVDEVLSVMANSDVNNTFEAFDSDAIKLRPTPEDASYKFQFSCLISFWEKDFLKNY